MSKLALSRRAPVCPSYARIRQVTPWRRARLVAVAAKEEEVVHHPAPVQLPDELKDVMDASLANVDRAVYNSIKTRSPKMLPFTVRLCVGLQRDAPEHCTSEVGSAACATVYARHRASTVLMWQR
jgi:hypothetical protein